MYDQYMGDLLKNHL